MTELMAGDMLLPLCRSVGTLFPEQVHKRILLVGGMVRDGLAGRERRDVDLAAALDDDELLALGYRRIPASNAVPVWFRSYAGVGTIELTQLTGLPALTADLARRDFTINAMAVDLDGVVHDPLGGRDDLRRGVLRACSPEVFRDDPLRLFRAARLEADGWRLTAETVALFAGQDWRPQLATVPVERFSAELLKACAARQPERFFDLLLQHSLGREQLPELFRMPDIPAGPLEHHPEGSLWCHSVQVLQRVAEMTSNPLARLCAFFHDIGKLATDPACYPRHHGHDQAGVKLAEALAGRLRLSVAQRRALAAVSNLHGTLNLWPVLRPATRLKVAAQAVKAGIVDILPLVSAADKQGNSLPAGWQEVVAIEQLSSVDLAIDRTWLEALPPAKRAAALLQKKVALVQELKLAAGEPVADKG